MKHTLFAMVLWAAGTSSYVGAGHPLPTVEDKINYSEVVTLEGVRKDDLYARAKLWIASTLHSTDDLILDDKESGLLVSRGIVRIKENEVGVRTMFNTKPVVEKTWRFTVKIQMKDGRYKVEMYDIEYTFAMPGNAVGHSPLPRDLDVLFLDKKMYNEDGSLRTGAPLNIANWTNERFNALLVSLKSALKEDAILDDF